ncbi:MAG: biotin/lipoyl-containing protein, partial [Paeniglutamicibacter terrestris]
MSETVNLPALGESVTEGTVTRWLKQVGDRVEVDEPLLEVSTDKVDTEIPSPVAGVIEEILVAEDETAEVGAALVRIGDGSGSAAAPAAAAPAEEAPAAPAEAPAAPAEAPAAASAPAAAPAAAASGAEITLPALGESVTEGTVTRWLKAVGDEVAVDEPLLEVSTDKVDTEVPSPVAGTLLEIRVPEDETVEVGTVLAIVGAAGAAAAPAPAAAPAAPAPAAAPAAPAPAAAAPAAASTPAAGGVVNSGYVTPLVRRLANQHGVDLSTVTGTGV